MVPIKTIEIARIWQSLWYVVLDIQNIRFCIFKGNVWVTNNGFISYCVCFSIP